VFTTVCLSRLHQVFEISAVHFEADVSKSHGVFLHMSQNYSIESRNSSVKSRYDIFDTLRRNWVHMFLQVSPQEEIQRSEVRRPRRPCSGPSKPNPPPWVRRVQPLQDIFSTVWRGSVVLELQPSSQSYGHIFKQPRQKSLKKNKISLSIQPAW
jgi:hypothetical protein